MENGVEEEEPVVTMSEFIEGLEAQELEADLVLGGDEGKECTYPKGYMPRQAVFSCLTCTPEGNAGVCTACSISCHDGHEVVELWTRRHFRCDCGNSKFGVGVCKLYSSKETVNNENLYNQNYKGLYCTCQRPYPDPDGEEHGEMLQCCVCEDWFHEGHLGLAPTEQVPRDEEGEPIFDELICQGCAAHLDFLSFYADLLLPPRAIKDSGARPSEELASAIEECSRKPLSVVSEAAAVPDHSSLLLQTSADSKEISLDTTIKNVIAEVQKDELQLLERESTESSISTSGDLTPKASKIENEANGKVQADDCEIENGKLEENGQAQHQDCDKKSIDCSSHSHPETFCCLLKQAKMGISSQRDETNLGNHDSNSCEKMGKGNVREQNALFLIKNWRSQLCRCEECSNMYLRKRVSFLLEMGDTLQEYEEVAKQKRKEKMEEAEGDGLAFLERLGHVGQIEFLHKLNDMTTELSSFFASFGESGKTITSEDVHEFFDNLNRKRRRLD